MMRRRLVVLVLAVACAACAATAPVRVLPRGETRIIASLGGPVLPQRSPTVVIPYATVGAMRGLTDRTTLVYDVHALAAVLGVAAVDVGAAHRLRAQDGRAPELTLLGQGYLFAGAGGVRFFPHASLNASWLRGQQQLLYAGVGAVGQFSGAPGVIGTPFVGWQFPATRHLSLETELKWMAATAGTEHGIFQGESSIGGHGALAFQLGAQWKR